MKTHLRPFECQCDDCKNSILESGDYMASTLFYKVDLDYEDKLGKMELLMIEVQNLHIFTMKMQTILFAKIFSLFASDPIFLVEFRERFQNIFFSYGIEACQEWNKFMLILCNIAITYCKSGIKAIE